MAFKYLGDVDHGEWIAQVKKQLKEEIIEWDSYLPEVKKQSIDVLVDNIVEILK